MIQKKISGYRYDDESESWSVKTDYVHGKIYLSEPHDDGDLVAIKNFGKAIIMAVKDMRKDEKK